MTPEYIKEHLELNKNLVTVKDSVKFPQYRVVKYKRKVFYDDLWNDFLLECRGLVLDQDNNVVSRPLKKIFNYGVEARAPRISDNKYVLATRKINGYMLAATIHNDQLVVSTTGSLDSWFADYGRNIIQSNTPLLENILKKNQNYTYIFEVSAQEDPHIITEENGLYLIGARDKITGELDTIEIPYLSNTLKFCEVFRLKQVPIMELQFSELKEQVKIAKHEGFVFYTVDGISSKIKSPYYLTKKMLMRSKMDKILSKDAKEYIDEEFYPLINYIKEVDSDYFSRLDEQAKKEYIENWYERKVI